MRRDFSPLSVKCQRQFRISFCHMKIDWDWIGFRKLINGKFPSIIYADHYIFPNGEDGESVYSMRNALAKCSSALLPSIHPSTSPTHKFMTIASPSTTSSSSTAARSLCNSSGTQYVCQMHHDQYLESFPCTRRSSKCERKKKKNWK